MSDHTENQSFVYVIQEGTSHRFKIGFTSKHPKDRLGSMSTGNPRPLHLVGFVEVDGKASENRVHEDYQDCHIRGEWFELSMADVHDILGIRKMPISGSYGGQFTSADGELEKEWALFVNVWAEEYGAYKVYSKELTEMCREHSLLSPVIGNENHMSQSVRLGIALREKCGDSYGGCRIIVEEDAHRGTKVYRLKQV